MQQVNCWFANKRNRTGNTRSSRKRQTLENGVLQLCEMLIRQQNQFAAHPAAAANGVPFAASSATSTSIPMLPSALSVRALSPPAADRLSAPLDSLCSLPLPLQQQHNAYLNNNPLAPPPPPTNGVQFSAPSATCTTVPLSAYALPRPPRMYAANGLPAPLDSHSLTLPPQQLALLNNIPSLTGTFQQMSTGFPFHSLSCTSNAAAASQVQQLLQPVWQSAFNLNTFNHYNPYKPFNAPSVNLNNPTANDANFLQNPFQNQNQQGSESAASDSTTSFCCENSPTSTNSVNPWWSSQTPSNNFNSQFVSPFPPIPNTE